MATRVNSQGLETDLKVLLEDTVASQSAPSLTFTNSTNTGIYRNSGDSSVNLTIGGTTVAKFTSTGIGLLSSANTPRASFDFGYARDSLILPIGTTGQRVSTTPGSARYNSSLDKLEIRNDTAWTSVIDSASLASGIETFLTNPTSSNLAAAVTNETGTPGSLVFSNSPTFTGIVTLPSTTSIGNVSAIEIGYVDGVTSSIQTQLDGKQATITGAATTITAINLTTNRALVSNGSGKVTVSTVTQTELGYVSGVTSSIQTQLNSKAPTASPTFTGTVTLPSTTSIGNVSSTEIGYIDGVTSSIQTQLNSKAPLTSPNLTGVPTAPTAAIGTNTTQIATTAFVQQIISVGSIHFFPSTNAPTGYLKLEGQLLNRTTYAALWAYIQSSGNLVTDANWSNNNQGAFSSGNGSTTFRLPDYRGQFLRVFDPSNSVDTDRTAIGQTQGDAIRNITGTINGVSETFGSYATNITGAFEKSPEQTNVNGTPSSIDTGGDAGFLTFDASNVVPVADENRPKNIAIVACIYAGV